MSATVDFCNPRIDTSVWERYKPRNQSYTCLRVARVKTVREVFAEVQEAVCEKGDWGWELPADCDEYLSLGALGINDPAWPEGRTVVYAVNGSSEGDYVHVAVVEPDGVCRTWIVGKTFAGRDAAWRFARLLADLFGV